MDKNKRIDKQLLFAWKAKTPPKNFSERILRKLEDAPGKTTRQTKIAPRYYLLALASVAIGALGWVFWPGSASKSEGEYYTQQREEIPLGHRGVVVVEPNTKISWSIKENGNAFIEQEKGNAFYRVEPGGRFFLKTPVGNIEVKGTCFRVEISDMFNKQTWSSAAIGAAATAVALVTVYEGKVLWANEKSSISLRAGEQAISKNSGNATTLEKVPSTLIEEGENSSLLSPPSNKISREELLTRDQAQRIKIAALASKLKTLETSLSNSPKDLKPQRGVKDVKFIDPSEEELLERAETCTLVRDTPSFKPLDNTTAEKFGVSSQEQQSINEISAKFSEKVSEEIQSYYIEITGDTQGATHLSPETMEREILSQANQQEEQEIFWQLSQEIAGLATPPNNLENRPPLEQFIRLVQGIGDRYERALAEKLGEERAHELRSMHDGWWGSHSISSSGCPEDQQPQ